MLGNDLSNKQAPYIMFDIDSLLFLEKEKTVWTKVSDMFKSEETKYLERPINQDFVNLLHTVWRDHNVCIGLVTFALLDKPSLEKLYALLDKYFVPYTRVFDFLDWEDLRNFGYSIYTFSANNDLISYMSKKEAMHISRIREVLS
jgi:hypothetical protein